MDRFFITQDLARQNPVKVMMTHDRGGICVLPYIFRVSPFRSQGDDATILCALGGFSDVHIAGACAWRAAQFRHSYFKRAHVNHWCKVLLPAVEHERQPSMQVEFAIIHIPKTEVLLQISVRVV